MAPAILLALSFHEFSHAYMAYRFGDDTARLSGRLTMNPFRHLDPIGTIMIFIAQFGWAKPVPVNPYRLQNPDRDMVWISAAGPLSNMLLALASGIVLRMFIAAGIVGDTNFISGQVMRVVLYSLQINLALAIFNLLPIAPLDGSKILAGILPDRFRETIFALEQHGPFILMGLIIFGQVSGVSILGRIIWPFVRFFGGLFAGI